MLYSKYDADVEMVYMLCGTLTDKKKKKFAEKKSSKNFFDFIF